MVHDRRIPPEDTEIELGPSSQEICLGHTLAHEGSGVRLILHILDKHIREIDEPVAEGIDILYLVVLGGDIETGELM